MDYVKRHNILFNKSRFADLVPVNAYADGKFFCEGDRSYIGAVWVGTPLIGADDSTVDMLRSALSGDTPADTILQFSYVSSSFIDTILGYYAKQRLDIKQKNSGLTDSQKDTMYEAYRRRFDLLQGSASKAMVKSTGVLTKNTWLIISVKIPVSKSGNERELEAVEAAMVRFEQAFTTIGFNPSRLNATQYMQFIRSILMMGKAPEAWYDDDNLIREQVLAPDTDMESKKDVVEFDCAGEKYYVRSLSATTFPKHTSLAVMNQLIGDPLGSHNQIPDPFMITTTVYFPDQSKKLAEIRKKENAINYQSKGPWYGFVARLRTKKEEGFDVLGKSIEEGYRPIMTWFNVQLFNRDYETSQRAAASLRTYFQISGYEMHEDRNAMAPYMLLNLPLFMEVEAIAKSFRFSTMTTKEVVHMLPAIGEWKGSGDGSAIMMAGRRGQPLLYDLFDSQTNYNAVIAAESGAGKSFLANDLIMAYMQKGAKLRVIDQGGSYRKICESVEGQWIEFDPDKPICLNPFTHVKNLNEEMELLKLIISKMAKPKDGLDDWELSQTESVIQIIFEDIGPAMTITDVAAKFQELGEKGGDSRLVDMASLLHSFTRHGSFGQYFDGPNTLDYSNNLAVLELQNLANMKHLQKVVLLQLIAQLQTECYMGDRDQRKVIIVDEAWELFEDPVCAKFLEGAYRKFRKYNSAIVIITQSLADLYNSEAGAAISSNSANTMVLRQKRSSIDDLEKTGRFNVGDYGFEMLRSLNTEKGKYADVFLMSGESWGVGRFVVEPFSQLLYSTAPEDVTKIKSLTDTGLSVVGAINHILEEKEGLHRRQA